MSRLEGRGQVDVLIEGSGQMPGPPVNFVEFPGSVPIGGKEPGSALKHEQDQLHNLQPVGFDEGGRRSQSGDQDNRGLKEFLGDGKRLSAGAQLFPRLNQKGAQTGHGITA